MACVSGPARAQQSAGDNSAKKDEDASGDLVVRGHRGSAIADVSPIASYDEKFIAGTGATSMNELLRVLTPMARSADGSDPIILLNGQRTSGWDEIQSLPTEALAGTEILPEAAAIKYGYPPTRRLLNFMTKANFRSVELSAYVGQSTAGGAGTHGLNLGLTRIANKKRLTLAGEYRHTDPLLSSRRPLDLDPDNLFDPTGNIVAATVGAEIDPALSAAAGHPVYATGVPQDLESRSQLSGYLANAGQLNIFDVRPYSTLIERNDAFKGNAVVKGSLGAGIDGTLTLTAERSWGRSLQGNPALTIFVPAGSPYSPFASDLFLYRFVTGQTDVQRTSGTTLHAGAVVQGGFGGWQWDVTSALDEADKTTRGDRGYDPTTINQAVANGANPFGDLDPALLGPRLSQQSTVINRTADLKAVARGALLHVPAGELSLVATIEGGLVDAHTRSHGYIDNDVRVNQSRGEGGLTIDIPLASKREDVLPFLGELSANLTARLRDVQDYGLLHDTTYGLNWTPLKGLQLTVTRNITEATPSLDLRSAATVENTNVPFFDFGTGKSAYVTLITGGNPDLAPEHKRVQSYGFTLKPFENSQLMFSGTYSESLIRDAGGTVSALTPETQAQLPDQFVRDEFGRLNMVILRPFNFYRQRQRTLNFQINFWTQTGKAAAPVAGKAKSRGSLYLGVAPYINLSDQLQLKQGLPPYNLLDGDTVDGSQYHFRVAMWGWGGFSKAGDGFSFNWQYQGPSRIHGGTPPTELSFGSRFNLDVSAFVWLRHWLPHAEWLKKTKLTLQVVNPIDSYVHVHDGNGETPFRYQRALIDPQGRTFKITLRKLFQ